LLFAIHWLKYGIDINIFYTDTQQIAAFQVKMQILWLADIIVFLTRHYADQNLQCDGKCIIVLYIALQCASVKDHVILKSIRIFATFFSALYSLC